MASFGGLSLFFLASWLVNAVLGLPTGAPSTACVSMYPQHPGPAGPASAQSGLVVPFQIQVAPAQDGTRAYKVTVVRNPNFPGQPNLLGFFLQVRDPNAETPLGEWKNLPVYGRVGDCGGSSTATHVANTPKPIDQGLEFTWEPTNLPLNTKSLQILGTFVQNMQTFWVKVPSQIFSVAAVEESQPPTAPVLVQQPVNNNNNNNNNNANTAPVATSSFGTTDQPSSAVNQNNVDMTGNDRRSGFGNVNAASSVNNPPNSQQPQPNFRLQSDGIKAAAGLFTVLAALLVIAL